MLYQAASIENLYLFSKCFQLDGLQCNIPSEQAEYLKKQKDDCIPIVECVVLDPYKKDSVLADNQCIKVCFISFALYLNEARPDGPSFVSLGD